MPGRPRGPALRSRWCSDRGGREWEHGRATPARHTETAPSDAPPAPLEGARPDDSPSAGGTLAVGPGAADGEEPTGGGRLRRLVRRVLPAPVWRVGRLLLVALVVEYFVVPQIAGTRKALHQLALVDPVWLLLGVLLEAVALLSYAQLTRSVLPRDTDPGLWTVLRIQMTTLSVSHCVPGGSAAGSGLGFRLLLQAGVKGPDVGFALGTQSLGSALVLNVIFWLALVVSIPVWGFSPLYLTAALVGLVLLAVLATLVVLLTRGEAWLAGLLDRAARRVPFVDAAGLRRLFEQVAARLRELLAHRGRVGRAAGWAAANWLLDAGSLAVFLRAFGGHWVNVDGLLVAYGLANVLAVIPLTPGGLGVVEATLTSALVGFGSTRAIALLGVVSYRLVNFWLPIPLGGLSYVSLQHDGPDRDRHHPAASPPAPPTPVGTPAPGGEG
ncbi:MAG TPA: YbhN family protein [Acidimicrobiales bacterium]|nr:YbhN family protein [Acidimicrobiales bacterium]